MDKLELISNIGYLSLFYGISRDYFNNRESNGRLFISGGLALLQINYATKIVNNIGLSIF